MIDHATRAGERWRSALTCWAIPPRIADQAPQSPFEIPPELFLPQHQTCSPAARRHALAGLGSGGTLLDIGCGCGAASLPLAPAATMITGLDASAAMLDEFDKQADHAGVPHRTIHGRWPEVAPEAGRHTVVTAHHIIYNVAAIEQFIIDLTQHALKRVVMEVTRSHPQSPLNDLWRHFHGVERPTEPTADDIIAVIRELGIDPTIDINQRGAPGKPVPRELLVSFARRRLCLTPQHDAEIDHLLPDDHTAPPRDVVCISWDSVHH
ncbi:MAG: methyltransferase domain-containing protein [Acidimicrobiia bacterium]